MPDPTAADRRRFLEYFCGARTLLHSVSVIVPHGFNEKGDPTSLTFVGGVFGETAMLSLAKANQNATDWHRKHPKLLP